MNKLYAIRSKISGHYWNEKKGTWTCYHLDSDVWYTKEQLEDMRKFYSDVYQLSLDNEEIVEKEVE